MSFDQEIIIAVIKSVLPWLVLVLGGKYLLDRYEAAKFEREKKIELAAFIRQNQYRALENLYGIFARYMALYRVINTTDDTILANISREDIYQKIVVAEGEVDSIIVRIGSEFTTEEDEELATMLGNLRQSVQIWRENYGKGKRLPFNSSDNPDYKRFKESFAKVTAYLASEIYGSLSPGQLKMEVARKLVIEAFDNIHEKHGMHDVHRK